MKNFILLLGFMLFAGMAMGQALKVASNGFIGVGITDPGRQLHVQGQNGIFRLDRSGDVGFLLGRYTSTDFSSAPASTYFVGASIRGGRNVFEVNDLNGALGGAGTRALLIDDNGSLVVGSQTTDTNYELHVEGSAFKSDGLSDWNVMSDRRLKNNVKSFIGGLDMIMEMNPVTYNYNGKAGTNPERSHIGIIAQELQKISPSMVSEFTIQSNGGYADIDNTGNEKTKEETFLSVNTSELQWILVNAIQDQQEIIENLQEQIVELRTVLGSSDQSIDNVDLVDVVQSTLGQNSPNPYNEGTVISYSVADDAASAKMNFYNLTGQLIKSVTLQNGSGKVNVSADELPSGTYTYSLEVDGALISNKKMVKMR